MRSQLPRRRWMLGVVFITATLVLAAAPAAAVSGWRGPFMILSDHSVTQVHLGVTGDGTIAILGRDETGLFHLTDRTGSWVRTQLVSRWAVLDHPDQFAGVFDRHGHAYLAWARGCAREDCSMAGIWYRDDASGGWSSPERLVAGAVSSPAMQLRDGSIHLAYLDARSRLHYRRIRDGDVIDAVIWPGESQSPRLVLSTKGIPNVVAVSLADIPVIKWAKQRPDGSGVTFRVRRVRGSLVTGYAYVQVPLIALDRAGRPRVAWTYHEVCGVDPCPPAPDDGAWMTGWTGSAWSAPRHASRADAAAIRVTPAGRVRLLTDRPSVVRETARGLRTTVLDDPKGGVLAAALALTPTGKARVVLSEWVKVGGRMEHRLLLMSER